MSDLECLPAAKKPRLGERDGEQEGKTSPGATEASGVSVAKQILGIEQAMSSALEEIQFIGGMCKAVTHIYNPLRYAASTHTDFVSRYGNSHKKILFIGMNPGPFGMAQNGVAFGDSAMVREWLCVKGEVEKPALEHPDRPIHGLTCSRAEVSGTRFWGLFKELCTTPQVFFANSYVHNYCPLCFMTKSGKNITPPHLKSTEKTRLQEICDGALLEVIRLLRVEWVVGVGKYGADRATAALEANCIALTGGAGVGKRKKSPSSCCGKRLQLGEDTTIKTYTLHQGGGGGCGRGGEPLIVRVCSIMHPSPINPAANSGWAGIVTKQFTNLGLLDIIKGAK